MSGEAKHKNTYWQYRNDNFQNLGPFIFQSSNMLFFKLILIIIFFYFNIKRVSTLGDSKSLQLTWNPYKGWPNFTPISPGVAMQPCATPLQRADSKLFKRFLTMSSLWKDTCLHSFFFIRINCIRILRLKIAKEHWKFQNKERKSWGSGIFQVFL